MARLKPFRPGKRVNVGPARRGPAPGRSSVRVKWGVATQAALYDIRRKRRSPLTTDNTTFTVDSTRITIDATFRP